MIMLALNLLNVSNATFDFRNFCGLKIIKLLVGTKNAQIKMVKLETGHVEKLATIQLIAKIKPHEQ